MAHPNKQGADPLPYAQEGLSLGLALARYIIEAYEAVIKMESILDRGSTFTVKLPRIKSGH